MCGTSTEIQRKWANGMKIDADGFKFVEADDRWQEGLIATFENTKLLHEQILELREILERNGILIADGGEQK